MNDQPRDAFERLIDDMIDRELELEWDRLAVERECDPPEEEKR